MSALAKKISKILTLGNHLRDLFNVATPVTARRFTVKSQDKETSEIRFDNHTPGDKALLYRHIDTALQSANHRNDPLEIAAAINDYLYQYLVLAPNNASAPQILRDGYSICGGASQVFAEMLYALGFHCKRVSLTGIPLQGSHSLDEVSFQDGSRGLYDPTFGMFWFDPANGRPVSFLDLLEHPELSNTTLYKSNFNKRNTIHDAVTPFSSISQSYTNRIDYKEDTYDPYLSFKTRSGASISGEGFKHVTKLTLTAGITLGEKVWDRARPKPWTALALLKNDKGRYLSWAYMLGQNGTEYDNRHLYRLTSLRPGQLYSLNLHYSSVKPKTLMTIDFLDSDVPPQYKAVPPLSFHKDNPQAKVLEILLTAPAASMSLLVDVTGHMLLHAIELTAGTSLAGGVQEEPPIQEPPANLP